MGAQQSQSKFTNSFNLNDWKQIYSYNKIKILSNLHNNTIQIQQHTSYLNNPIDLKFLQQILMACRNDSYLINVLNYSIVNNQIGYAHNYKPIVLIYTQRIVNRLGNVGLLKFPDPLHVIYQAIHGLQKLVKFYGYFKVNPNCIGINQQNIAKVWHSPDFVSVNPQYMANSQEQMILAIINSIEAHTDLTTMPIQQTSFRTFLFKNCKALNFSTAKIKLMQYINYFNNGKFPNNLIHPNIVNHHQMNHKQINQIRIRNQYNYPIYSQPNQFYGNIVHNSFQNRSHNYNPLQKAVPLNNYQIIQSHIPITSIKSNVNHIPIHNSPSYIHPSNKLPTLQQIMPINNNFLAPVNKRHNFEAKVPMIIRNKQQFIRPTNIQVNSLRSSTIYNQQKQRTRKNSVASVKLQNNYKPSQNLYQIKPYFLQKNISESAKSSPKIIYNYVSNHRPHSARQSSLNVYFANNTAKQGFINNQLISKPIQINQIQHHPHRELKPMIIKQSIQRSEHINMRFGYQPNKNQVKGQKIISQQSYVLSKNLTVSQVNNPSHSLHIKINQDKKLADPWQTIMKVVNSKVNNFEQTQKQDIIFQKPYIAQQDTKSVFNPISVSQGIQSQRDKNQPNNVSFSSQASGMPVAIRDFSNNIFNDAKDTQSINNSYVRNYYGNMVNQDYSQIIQRSSSLDFILAGKKYDISKMEQTMGMSTSKLLQQKRDLTALDLMQKLKRTQTIIKNDQYNKTDPDQQNQSHKRSTRSIQFNNLVAQLGFNMNQQQNNNNLDQVSIKLSPNNQQKQITHQLTRFYPQKIINHIYKNTYEQKPKYEWQKKQPKQFLPNHPVTINKNYNQYSFNRTDLAYKTQFPNYDILNKQPQKQYKFEWDPELLADIQSAKYRANNV